VKSTEELTRYRTRPEALTPEKVAEKSKEQVARENEAAFMQLQALMGGTR